MVHTLTVLLQLNYKFRTFLVSQISTLFQIGDSKKKVLLKNKNFTLCQLSNNHFYNLARFEKYFQSLLDFAWENLSKMQFFSTVVGLNYFVLSCFVIMNTSEIPVYQKNIFFWFGYFR